MGIRIEKPSLEVDGWCFNESKLAIDLTQEKVTNVLKTPYNAYKRLKDLGFSGWEISTLLTKD